MGARQKRRLPLLSEPWPFRLASEAQNQGSLSNRWTVSSEQIPSP